jgi:hypothetical protein
MMTKSSGLPLIRSFCLIRQITRCCVQPRFQKYFASLPTQNICLLPVIPCPQEGRIAIVTDVERGERWTREYRKTNGADADGEVVWSRRPDAGVKLRGRFRAAMVTKSRSPRRARNKP